MRKTRDPYERLLDRAILTVSGCWEVQGLRVGKGYVWVSVGGRAGTRIYGHRVSYERNVGPIPDEYVVDHMCRNRACINPDHLQAMTFSENSGNTTWKAKMFCPEGHPYDDENTVVNNRGWRDCKICRRKRDRKYHQRKREGLEDGRKVRKEFCANGHPYDEENTYWYPSTSSSAGKRKCRACDRERHRIIAL